MKRRLITVLIVFFVCINYYHYYKASVVGSKGQRFAPAAYKAIGTLSLSNPAVRSTLSQRRSLGSLSLSTNAKPESFVQKTTQLVPARQLSSGTIRGRMLQQKQLFGVKQGARYVSHGKKHPQLFGSASLDITMPMLELALEGTDIKPTDVTIYEIDDPLRGWASIMEEGFTWEGEEPITGLDRRNVKYMVVHPRVIRKDGTVDLHALAVAAHEFMHVRNKDQIRREEKIKQFDLRRKQLGDAADRNREAELNEFRRLYEEKADTDAALLYHKLGIADYLTSVMRNCLERNLTDEDRRSTSDKYGNNLTDVIHPPLTKRINYLTPIAGRQAQARRKDYEKDLESYFLGTIVRQKPPSAIDQMRQKYLFSPEFPKKKN